MAIQLTRLPNVIWPVPSREVVNNSSSGREPSESQLSIAADNQPVPIIYGMVRMGPRLAYVTTYAGQLVLLTVWGHGEIHGYNYFWSDDKPASLNVETRLGGADNNVIPSTITSAITGYTDILPGIAYSVFKIPPAENQGFPRINALISGLKVHDPRLGSDRNVKYWSDNPALCLADFISNDVYGMGLDIDWDSVADVADFNDTLLPIDAELQKTGTWTSNSNTLTITCNSHGYAVGKLIYLSFTGGTVPDTGSYYISNILDNNRFTISYNITNGLSGGVTLNEYEKSRTLNLALENQQECTRWVETLRAYASCWVINSNGIIKLIADKEYTGTINNFIHEDGNILGINTITKKGTMASPNILYLNYTDTSVVPYKSSPVKIDAAGSDAIKESTISLPGINRYSQAKREATERINKLRLNDLSFNLEVFDEGIEIEAGDVIGVQHPIGINNGLGGPKLMRVTGVTTQEPGRYTYSCVEYDPIVYSTQVENEPTWQDTDLPDPFSIVAPTGLTGSEDLIQLQNGTYTNRLNLTWNSIAAAYPYSHYYEVTVLLGTDIVDTRNVTDIKYSLSSELSNISLLGGTEYACEVRAVNSIGIKSNPATTNFTIIGKYAKPGNVSSISAFEAGGIVSISWTPAIDLDIWRYDLRYTAEDPTAPGANLDNIWDGATIIDVIDSLAYTSRSIPVGTFYILVKAIDSVNLTSVTPAYVKVIVTSDANAFLVDSKEQTNPTLTNMASYTLGPADTAVYYVTEDDVSCVTKFATTPLSSTYTNPLATYHSSITSSWVGELEDFGYLLGGQWTGTCSAIDIDGSSASEHTSYMLFSVDNVSWDELPGLSHIKNARYAKIKHEALTTNTLKLTYPNQNIRIDSVPRTENGEETTGAVTTGFTTVVLNSKYAAVKKILLTAGEGASPIIPIYDNVVIGPEVENTGFEETTLTSWSLVEGSGTCSATDSIYHAASGSTRAMLFDSDTTNCGYGSKALSVEPGTKINIRAWVYCSGSASSGFTFRMNEKDVYPAGGYVTATNRNSITNLFNDVSLAGGWQLKEAQYTVPAGVYWISIAFYHWTGLSGYTLVIDSVEFDNNAFDVYTFNTSGTLTNSTFTYEFQGI